MKYSYFLKMNMIKKQVYKCNVYMEVGCIELFKGTGPMIDGIDFYVPSILGTKPSSIYYTDLLSYIFLFFQFSLILKRYKRFSIFVQVQLHASFQNKKQTTTISKS